MGLFTKDELQRRVVEAYKRGITGNEGIPVCAAFNITVDNLDPEDIPGDFKLLQSIYDEQAARLNALGRAKRALENAQTYRYQRFYFDQGRFEARMQHTSTSWKQPDDTRCFAIACGMCPGVAPYEIVNILTPDDRRLVVVYGSKVLNPNPIVKQALEEFCMAHPNDFRRECWQLPATILTEGSL